MMTSAHNIWTQAEIGGSPQVQGQLRLDLGSYFQASQSYTVRLYHDPFPPKPSPTTKIGISEDSMGVGMRKTPMFEYLVPSWWNCLERMRRCGLLGGVSLRAGREVVSKTPCPS